MRREGESEWDVRFAGEEYAYGKEPNDFLRAMSTRLPPPPAQILSLAEGEGRNAVFLAGLGHEVTAVDASTVGLAKGERLAAERGVSISTVHADLADHSIERGVWDAVVMIFCHLPPPLRREVHRQVVEGLRPGGVALLEAYSPRQLEFGTGGPQRPELLYTVEALRADFDGLDFELLHEVERPVVEGKFHSGRAAVVQLFARKPQG